MEIKFYCGHCEDKKVYKLGHHVKSGLAAVFQMFMIMDDYRARHGGHGCVIYCNGEPLDRMKIWEEVDR